MKPVIAGLSDTVANEAACLRFASLTGTRSAGASITHLGGRDVLVVERFDRRTGADGTVARAHQESACQALAVPVAANARKYEADGGPNLRAIAGLLTRWSTPEALHELLRQTTINVLVGNADAHAMNTSFVIDELGSVAPSPLYDVFSTVAYPQLSTTPGMFINGCRDIRAVQRVDLVAESVSWGLASATAQSIVDDVTACALAAMSQAIAELQTPDDLASQLLRQVQLVS